MNLSIVCAEAICCGREFHSIIVLGKKLYLNVFVLQQYGLHPILCERVVGRVQGVRYRCAGKETRLSVILYSIVRPIIFLLCCRVFHLR